MGRPSSNTVEYFPNFVKPGEAEKIITKLHGNNGYGFLHRLWTLLCDTENHFYDARLEIKWQNLLTETGVDETTGNDYLNLLSKLGEVDSELWTHKIIWCQSIPDRLVEVYRKRGRPVPEKPDNNGFLSQKPISVAETPQSTAQKSTAQYSKEGNKPIDAFPINDISDALTHLPLGIDNLAQHEAIKQAIANIGTSKGYRVESEYVIGIAEHDKSRVDICWLSHNDIVAAFEIDSVRPKRNSIAKLKATKIQNVYIVLRKPHIHLVNLYDIGEDTVRMIFGEFKNVLLSQVEHNKLVERLGPKETNYWIEKLSSYMKSHNKRYDDHYATICHWLNDNVSKSEAARAGSFTARTSPGARRSRIPNGEELARMAKAKGL